MKNIKEIKEKIIKNMLFKKKIKTIAEKMKTTKKWQIFILQNIILLAEPVQHFWFLSNLLSKKNQAENAR